MGKNMWVLRGLVELYSVRRRPILQTLLSLTDIACPQMDLWPDLHQRHRRQLRRPNVRRQAPQLRA